jgi:hypothetical protein
MYFALFAERNDKKFSSNPLREVLQMIKDSLLFKKMNWQNPPNPPIQTTSKPSCFLLKKKKKPPPPAL